MFIFFSIMVVANDCFRRLLYIFGYFRAFSCMPTLACFSQTISTAMTAGLRRSLKFHPLLHHQRACNSQSRLLPHHLSWVLKPSMFLAYLSVLLPDVAPWEGPSDDTDPRLRFGVYSPGAGLRWRGWWIGRGSHRLASTLNLVDNVWTNPQRGRAKECECGVAGAGNLTPFLQFSVRRLLQDPRSRFRPLNDVRDAPRRSSLM